MYKHVSIILLSVLLLAACASTGTNVQIHATNENSENSPQKNGHSSLHLSITNEPTTLDPGQSVEIVAGTLMKQLFEGLMTVEADGAPQKGIAESVTISPDLKSYIFKLRDAKWSNGDTVTAHDFEFAWKRVLKPETGSSYAYQLYVIKNAEKFNTGEIKDINQVGVKALDDKTLSVELENPTSYFLELTSFVTFMPVNKKIVEKNPEWANNATENYVCNGPFKLAAWKHKDNLEMVKNEQYWDKENVKLTNIKFNIIEDASTAYALFESGDLDWIGAPISTLPTDLIPILKEQGKLKTKEIAGTYWYSFNTQKEPFNNANIRKAFTLAINRKDIIDNVAQSDQPPAMGILPPTMAFRKDGYFKDNDRESAKKLLEKGLQELGKAPEQLDITLSYNTDDLHQKIAVAIQDQWRKVLGVNVKLANTERKIHLDNQIRGNFQVSRSGWLGDFNDPIAFLEVFRDKQMGNNFSRWENPEFKDVILKCYTETDMDKRKELLARAEEIAMNEMPVAPIYFFTNVYTVKENVKGITMDGLGGIYLKNAYKE